MGEVDAREVAFKVAMAVIGLVGVVLLVQRYVLADPGVPVVPDPVAVVPTELVTPTDEAVVVAPTSTEPVGTPSMTEEPTPTEDPVEAELAELRETDMWIQLAEWDRAGEATSRFRWSSRELDCPYAEFSNAEEVWNSFAPQLRDELLLLVIEEGIRPETVRFRGKPIQDDFVAGVIGWWTNGVDGTQGRGTMFEAEASYLTAEFEPRLRAWPVLIGHGVDPSAGTEAYLRGVGPPQDLAVSEMPDTYAESNELFNQHHRDWLFAQAPITPPVDPPLNCPS